MKLLLNLAALITLATLGGCSPQTEPAPDSPTATLSPPPTLSNQPAPEPSSAPPTYQATTTATGHNANLLLGNPPGASDDANNRLVERPQFALSYNKSNGGPNWVAWHLDRSDIGRVGRGQFWPDPLLPPDSQIRPGDYRGSGYDRGHQCPSGDRTNSRENNDATFVMSNMLPQAASLNREVWAKLENYCRDQGRAGNELYIVCGGSGTQGRVGKGLINVPAACWKVIVSLPEGNDDLSRINEQTRVIAVSMPNQNSPEVGGARWASFLTTPASIEAATGTTFFSNLPDATRQALEGKKDSGRAARGSNKTSNDSPTVGNNESAGTSSTDTEAATSPVETATPDSDNSTSSESPRAPTSPDHQAPTTGQSSEAQVWVNMNSGIYHYPGTRWYGNTKNGEYMSEKDARRRDTTLRGTGSSTFAASVFSFIPLAMRQKHAPPKKTEPRICQVCQAPFLATKQEVKRGWALFCSRKCRGVPRMVPHNRTTGFAPVFEMRKQLGLTQKKFAVEVGLSKSLIEKCERAGGWPRSTEARQKTEQYAHKEE